MFLFFFLIINIILWLAPRILLITLRLYTFINVSNNIFIRKILTFFQLEIKFIMSKESSPNETIEDDEVEEIVSQKSDFSELLRLSR